MRSSTLLSLLFATLCTGVLMSACGDDDSTTAAPLTPSQLGESCGRTGDCLSGLACVNNFCQMGSGTGGDMNMPAGPALGEEGESCTRRADCTEGLLCIDQRCVMMAGQGGTGNIPGPRLGGRGESCQVVGDCDTGLTCLERTVGGGVCDYENYGLMPTGKVCTGECAAEADCCELPTNLGYKSCIDLQVSLLGGTAAAATNCPATGAPAVGYELGCFYYRTYCNCPAATWACNANRCSYTATCTVNGTAFGGCPTYTRSNSVLPSTTCDLNIGKCSQAQPCTDAASCDGDLVFDDQIDSCAVGECTCYQSNCYRRCNEDTDCPQRYTCNLSTFVCEPGAGCSSNEECAVRLFDATAQCAAGACVIPCTVDQDCSDSGTLGGGTSFSGMVCNQGVCKALGCTTHEECQGTAGIRMFCVDAPAAAAGVRSAITD